MVNIVADNESKVFDWVISYLRLWFLELNAPSWSCLTCSLIDDDAVRISSKYAVPVTLGRCSTSLAMFLWRYVGTLQSPNTSTFGWYKPEWVLKASFSAALSVIRHWWSALARSSIVNTLLLLSLSNWSEMFGVAILWLIFTAITKLKSKVELKNHVQSNFKICVWFKQPRNRNSRSGWS